MFYYYEPNPPSLLPPLTSPLPPPPSSPSSPYSPSHLSPPSSLLTPLPSPPPSPPSHLSPRKPTSMGVTSCQRPSGVARRVAWRRQTTVTCCHTWRHSGRGSPLLWWRPGPDWRWPSSFIILLTRWGSSRHMTIM